MKHKFAAQLFTLRKELKADFPAVLRKLKAMGWNAVQIDGLHGYSAVDIAAVLEETGLQTAGMHVSLDRMYNRLDEVLEEARLFKAKEMFCNSLPGELQTVEGYRLVKEQLNDVARRAESAGIRVGFHNHDFEFHTMVDGKFALEYLLDPADGNRIYAEIDSYWVKKGGQDPLAFMSKYPNRMPIMHLKDMTNDERQTFAEIGSGSIEFAPLLQWGEANGVEWYAVEQDYCPGDPFDSLQISLNYLNQLADQLQNGGVR